MRKAPEKRRGAVADAHLWRAVAESARPLKTKKGKRLVPRVAPEPLAETPPAAPAARETHAPRPAPAARPKPVPAPPALRLGAVADIDRNTARRLKQGEMPIEATLDLHGLTQESAHAALAAFIARARAAGRRCLLIVTGKGGRAGQNGEPVGVLRANVPRWLNEPGLRPHVLAVAQARPRHGGEGALYVLLKRARGAPP